MRPDPSPEADLLARLRIQDLVQRTARLLDHEDFPGWLALFEPNSTYEIDAHSAELGRGMTWWSSSYPELERLVSDVGRHVRDPARRLHLVSPPLVDVADGTASVHSTFAIYRTLPGGETSLYVAGRYDDLVVERAGQWKYQRHRVIADTRVLDMFSHVPL